MPFLGNISQIFSSAQTENLFGPRRATRVGMYIHAK